MFSDWQEQTEGISCVSVGATPETQHGLSCRLQSREHLPSLPNVKLLSWMAVSAPRGALSLSESRDGAEGKEEGGKSEKGGKVEKKGGPQQVLDGCAAGLPQHCRGTRLCRQSRVSPALQWFPLHHPLALGCNSSQFGSVLAAPVL